MLEYLMDKRLLQNGDDIRGVASQGPFTHPDRLLNTTLFVTGKEAISHRDADMHDF